MSFPAPRIEEHAGIAVVRDDFLPGGTKMRGLMPVIERSRAQEFVFASPAQGYLQVALAHCAQLAGRRATIFTAKRRAPHPLTARAKAAGAKIVMVPHGRLNVVQARARAYAEEVGAELIPLGCDNETCIQAIAADARKLGAPTSAWSVAGSGVLTRALQLAWPRTWFYAVVVGKKDIDVGRAERYDYPLGFEEPARLPPPFPSCVNYDAKGWEYAAARGGRGALFWNVGA